MFVKLGNAAAVERPGIGEDNPAGETIALDGLRVTEITFPEGRTLMEALREITDEPGGLWAAHSEDAPEWVASDNEALEAALAEHYGCDRGEPADVEETHHTRYGPPGVGPVEEDE